MPFDPVAQVEHIGGVVRLFPAFGQVGLHDESARLHLRTDLMPHQSTVDEAQGEMRSGSDCQMGIKVRRVKPAHA